MGSKGLDVRTVQLALGITADGVFGSNTRLAVVEFQSRNGLVPDGEVGKNTLKMLMGNRTADIGRNTKFQLTRFLIREADIEDIDQIVDAITPLFQDTVKVRKRLTLGLKTVFPHREAMGLDSPEALAHFFGQIRQEVGRSWNDQENLNYSVSGLKATFKYYRKNPHMAAQHGRRAGKPAKQISIANHAYSKRMGNGSIQSNDGWCYRGGGAKMITGKNNHIALDKYILQHFPAIAVRTDFTYMPDLKWHPLFSLLTGAVFWHQNKLDTIAKAGGINYATSKKITSVINKYTNSYKDRWNHTKRAAQLLGVPYE
jgi:putative chitinase